MPRNAKLDAGIVLWQTAVKKRFLHVAICFHETETNTKGSPVKMGAKKDEISRTRGRELCSPSPPSPNMQWLYLGWVMGELGGGGGGRGKGGGHAGLSN